MLLNTTTSAFFPVGNANSSCSQQMSNLERIKISNLISKEENANTITFPEWHNSNSPQQSVKDIEETNRVMCQNKQPELIKLPSMASTFPSIYSQQQQPQYYYNPMYYYYYTPTTTPAAAAAVVTSIPSYPSTSMTHYPLQQQQQQDSHSEEEELEELEELDEAEEYEAEELNKSLPLVQIHKQHKMKEGLQKSINKPVVRRKGWNRLDHIKFLIATFLHGKGNWKLISKHIQGKSPKQCQSHGQKFFLRQQKASKSKRSIHDFCYGDLIELSQDEKYRKSIQDVTLNELFSKFDSMLKETGGPNCCQNSYLKSFMCETHAREHEHQQQNSTSPKSSPTNNTSPPLPHIQTLVI